MFHQFKKFFKRKRLSTKPIDPDEIFLDSKNLPDFDVNQFEGRIEKPISMGVLRSSVIFLLFIGLIFFYKIWDLQIDQGEKLRTRSENNSLHKTLIFADRGVIYDRNGDLVVWNEKEGEDSDYSLRVYATSTGLSTTLGYIKYPMKDSSGIYYQSKVDPKDGIEKIYDNVISGINGTKIIETDVKGNIVSQAVVEKPQNGQNLSLSIDLDLQKKLTASVLDIANRAGYKGGSSIIMDIHTGEIMAISNFPEYDSQIMTSGSDSRKINNWINDKNYPFLNRGINGLYTPGSIMKLFVALGVLKEGVISPNKQILSTGSMSVPNPFQQDKPSIFLDWKAHGYVDLREAIAVSSNIYFYQVGGGFESQKGIGIDNIEKYSRMFGFGTTTGIFFPGEKSGTIPSPEWKKKTFGGDLWRVGDTYNTAIGQYGFQVSPIQAVRAVAGIATEGKLVTPTLTKVEKNTDIKEVQYITDIESNFYKIVKEGMRLGVTEGTSSAINFPYVKIASKTGTAQIGVSKNEVNSWVVGFWPYENRRYAYVVVMERGGINNQFGAVLVMREVFEWMNIYAKEYLN